MPDPKKYLPRKSIVIIAYGGKKKNRVPPFFKAVLRRTSDLVGEEGSVVEFDKLQINIGNYEVRIDGKVIDMPPKELELLYFLAKNPNKVFTRDQLLDKVWGFEYFGDSRTIDVHIKRLRQKLEGVSDRWELKTVWGVGYKFEASV